MGRIPGLSWLRRPCLEGDLKFRCPRRIRAGEEVVLNALEIPKHRYPIRIKYFWGDDTIKVLGVNMAEPNTFEFPANRNTTSWYLKFAVKGGASPGRRQVYLTVESLRTNWPVILGMRLLAILLIALPLISYVSNRLGSDFLNRIINIQVSTGFGTFAVPIGLILFGLLWSSKLTTLINRLAAFKENQTFEYAGKGYSYHFIRIVQFGGRNNLDEAAEEDRIVNADPPWAVLQFVQKPS